MTRKRDRDNLERLLSSPCPYCNGTARIKSLPTVAFDLFREIKRIRQQSRQPMSLTVNVHPDVADYLLVDEGPFMEKLQADMGQRITVRSIESFHHEQFEIFEF